MNFHFQDFYYQNELVCHRSLLPVSSCLVLPLHFPEQIMFVLMVIGVIAGVYTLRYVLYQKIGSNAQVIASIINVVQIQILTYVYDFIAFKLTDLENQRNDINYEDSMIIKLFLFQFVNNYSSFYFLAFIAGYLEVPVGAQPNSQVRTYSMNVIIFLHSTVQDLLYLDQF